MTSHSEIAFPKKTIEYAKAEAKKIREECGKRRSKIRYNLATMLYDHLDYSYGYYDAVRDYNFCRWPHEVKEKGIICFELAVGYYVIAKELGLNPRFFNAYGYANGEGGIDDSRQESGHSIIDVDAGHRKRIILDKQMAIFGHVTYDGNYIRIEDNDRTSNTVKKVLHLEEMSEQEIGDKVRFLKTTKGSIKMLGTGQRVKRDSNKEGGYDVLVNYDPSSNDLQFRFYLSRHFFMSKALIHRISMQNGKPKAHSIDSYFYKERKWLDMIDEIKVGTLDYGTIIQLSRLIAKTGKVRWKDSFDRFEDSIGLTPPDKLDGISNDLGLEMLIRLASEEYKRIDETGPIQRSLQASALYDAERRKMGREDGYIYTREDRDAFSRELFEKFPIMVDEGSEIELIKHMSNSRLIPYVNSIKRRERRIRRKWNKFFEDLDSLNYHRRFNPGFYDSLTDKDRFLKERIKGNSPEEMGAMVEKEGGDYRQAYISFYINFTRLAAENMGSLRMQKLMPNLKKLIGKYQNGVSGNGK